MYFVFVTSGAGQQPQPHFFSLECVAVRVPIGSTIVQAALTPLPDGADVYHHSPRRRARKIAIIISQER